MEGDDEPQPRERRWLRSHACRSEMDGREPATASSQAIPSTDRHAEPRPALAAARWPSPGRRGLVQRRWPLGRPNPTDRWRKAWRRNVLGGPLNLPERHLGQLDGRRRQHLAVPLLATGTRGGVGVVASTLVDRTDIEPRRARAAARRHRPLRHVAVEGATTRQRQGHENDERHERAPEPCSGVAQACSIRRHDVKLTGAGRAEQAGVGGVLDQPVARAGYIASWSSWAFVNSGTQAGGSVAMRSGAGVTPAGWERPRT